MCLQEFLNPFCEEVENAFFQPDPVIQEIAGNLRLKHKKNVSCKLLCWVLAQLRELNPHSESESEKHDFSRSCVSLYPGEWDKPDIEKYLLIKPKRSYLTLRSSTCAFNV